MIVPDVVTHSGQPVLLQNPAHTAVVPADLNVHLLRTCRYLGAIDVSVLEHLAFCVHIGRNFGLPAPLLAHLAIHDAHEAYVGDVASRFKVPEYRGPEKRWERWVHECLRVQLPPAGSGDAIQAKLVDVAALFWEMEMHNHPGLPAAMEHLAGFHALLEAQYPAWREHCNAAWTWNEHRGWWDTLCKQVPALLKPGPLRPEDETAWTLPVRYGPPPRCWVRVPDLPTTTDWWRTAQWVDEEHDAARAAELGVYALDLEDGDVDGDLMVEVLTPGSTEWRRINLTRSVLYVAANGSAS